MKLLVFDFDKTLTTTDTLLPIARFICAKDKRKAVYLAVMIIYLFFRFKFNDERKFKTRLVYLILKNKTEKELNEQLIDFYKLHFRKLFISNILEIITDANEKGFDIFIISSNYSVFIKPALNLLNIKDVEATNLEIGRGVFTGNIIGEICNKSEKVKRLNKIKSKSNYSETIAYGDSVGDYEMLKNSDKAFLVKIKTKDPLGTSKRKKIKAILYYLIGKVYKPDCETEIIKFTG